jgi:putative flavoprotein involved in K+ transport
VNQLLESIDAWITKNGGDRQFEPERRFEKTEVDAEPQLSMDLARDGIKTVLWATGYRPDYAWLHVPALARKGRIRHTSGVVDDAPGLYVMGLPFLRRRKSSFIAGDDARDLADHLRATLHRSAA